ncbi:MAG TPA: DUF3833 domain-containing protein [Rhodocyclaceae bacterium]|nr:DUF3833 domain-containing protein [Rhodocyclaceae bacterium]
MATAAATPPRRFGQVLLAPLAALLLAGCAGISPCQYAAEKPALDLATYFNGTIDGWGMFQKRSGEVVKRFHVVIDARWHGDTGVLDEQFSWSDGSSSRRVWTLTRQADGRYLGRADDVVGAAAGQAAGNALRWKYVLALPVDGKTWHVDMDDWMYLIDEQVMLNRTTMSKWGVDLGQVTLSFTQRRPGT